MSPGLWIALGLAVLAPLQGGDDQRLGPAVQESSSCARCHSNAPRATAMRAADGSGIAPYDLWAPVGVDADENFGAGRDRVRYEVALEPPDSVAPSGPLTIEAALLYQPLGARWAAELLHWNTPEVETFRRLYEQAELAPEVLATDRWQE